MELITRLSLLQTKSATLKVSRLTITDELMICHTQDEQANYYTTDEPMICHTQGEQANYYTTDEPMICHTRGEQANYYTTDEPMICHTRGEQANYYTTVAVPSLVYCNSLSKNKHNWGQLLWYYYIV
jgi:hypothetical protein